MNRPYLTNMVATDVFTVDVGWAGFFWYFGLLATAGLFILLAKAALRKKSVERQYLTYGCISIILLSIASGPIIFYHQIVSVMTILYLIYGKRKPQQSSSSTTITMRIPSTAWIV